jgi:hypothetical protein
MVRSVAHDATERESERGRAEDDRKQDERQLNAAEPKEQTDLPCGRGRFE